MVDQVGRWLAKTHLSLSYCKGSWNIWSTEITRKWTLGDKSWNERFCSNILKFSYHALEDRVYYIFEINH